MHFLHLLVAAATVSAASVPEQSLRSRTACPYATSAELAFERNAIYAAKLVPDLIPSFKPTLRVDASYPGQKVNYGNTFTTLRRTVPEPTISFTAELGYDPAKTNYTIFLLDPDAPNPTTPILKDYLHLLISDAQPVCITTQKRKTLASYMSPTPLSVAPHRYTFLVYRQPKNYVPPPSLNYAPGARNNFDLAAYVKQGGLQGPVGANYYREGLAQAA
ncbi:hypothetical protein B0A48_12025 [Cryoendolithus antarcticus]|uniref:Phosphatidylethanolamine-binding protein n=1 Tax=Cryoendolithus antarcticus TaxID=1507870 RepID=A0A1V8SU26_9PEZI|nr:hypothetical protein B0A48_12025 [Cryoendolithus antarcticus]